jgi:CubicO group peptidase (beta-lactamase class C family)
MKGVVSIALLFVVLISCNAQPSVVNAGNNPNATALDSFINRKGDSLLKKLNLPGMLIAVSDAGVKKYYRFGYANPNTKQLFDSSTTVEIGSISKTFTAFVLMKVLQEKGISYKASIGNYLPDSVKANTTVANISFLQLMNHTSGLPRLPENMDATVVNPMQPYENYTLEHLMQYLVKASPEPTEESKYSNLGAGLAGVLAERISGKSYEQLVQQYIIEPFGMQHKGLLQLKDTSNHATGFFNGNEAVYWNMQSLAPAGGIKLNAVNMLRYIQAMAIPSAANKALVDTLTEVTVSLSPTMNVCLAWHTFERKNKPTIYWHNGGTYGFSTFAAFCKAKNSFVFVVVNAFDKNAASDGLGIAIMNKLVQ